jgi:Transposase
VCANDALEDRADEEGGPHLAQPSRTDSQLVPCEGAISAGTVEGLNNKVKRTTRKSYGFRTYEAIEISLYHNLGRLPEPDFTHRFW